MFYQSQYGSEFGRKVTQLDYPPHIHNAVELVVLTAGNVTAQCGRERLELQSGDVFIAFPNQVHSYENSRDVECYLLILPVKQYLTPYATVFANQKPESAMIRRGTWEHTGLKTLLEMVCVDAETASVEVLRGYAQVIFGKLLNICPMSAADGQSNELIGRLLCYLETHYKEPLSRETVARAMGYNESYISHVISKNLQTTLSEYINSLRIYDATMMLQQTDIAITQIVEELGYGSIRNFNRVFRKQMGVSPREYRQTKKKGSP